MALLAGFWKIHRISLTKDGESILDKGEGRITQRSMPKSEHSVMQESCPAAHNFFFLSLQNVF